MERLREKQFLALMREYRPDVGFVCFVGPDRIQHALFRNLEQAWERGTRSSPLGAEIRHFYLEFDEILGRLLSEFEGTNILLVSDHGHAPYRRDSNLNSLLVENGFLIRRSRTSARVRQGLISTARVPFPWWFRKYLKKRYLRGAAGASWSKYDIERSRAFTIANVNGVFVNDSGRFPSSAVCRDDYDAIVDELVEMINRNATTEYPIRAEPCRRRCRSSFYGEILPDVIVDEPEDCSPSHQGEGDLVTLNPNYRVFEDHDTVDSFGNPRQDVLSGIHRAEAMFLACGPDVSAAMDAFRQWTLDECYGFILRLVKSS